MEKQEVILITLDSNNMFYVLYEEGEQLVWDYQRYSFDESNHPDFIYCPPPGLTFKDIIDRNIKPIYSISYTNPIYGIEYNFDIIVESEKSFYILNEGRYDKIDFDYKITYLSQNIDFIDTL